MMKRTGEVRNLMRLAFVLGLTVWLGGCALAGRGEGQTELKSAYLLAVDSYLAGQYEKAGSIFQRLSGSSEDPVLARKAYFGLACSRLATAKTPQDLHDGLALWNNWAQMAPEGLPSEDPRLITPLLPRLGPANAAGGPALLSAGEIDSEVSRSQRLAGCQEETGKLKESLRKKTAEAENLRSQLNALERLHQEISQKKKGLE